MRNRQRKFGWKIPSCFGKIATSPPGGFFDSHCTCMCREKQLTFVVVDPLLTYVLRPHQREVVLQSSVFLPTLVKLAKLNNKNELFRQPVQLYASTVIVYNWSLQNFIVYLCQYTRNRGSWWSLNSVFEFCYRWDCIAFTLFVCGKEGIRTAATVVEAFHNQE